MNNAVVTPNGEQVMRSGSKDAGRNARKMMTRMRVFIADLLKMKIMGQRYPAKITNQSFDAM
ncbi:hypothetical protein SAMN05192541_1646 [Bradyrhizobium arachidis]|nr:hypothetical protein SAMN05192541_1646 [Bradyrhizobium arachidis]